MPKDASTLKYDQTTRLYLFVGPSDSGKSYAASSFGFRSKKFGGDDDRTAYLIDCDGREAALAGRPVEYDTYTNIEGAIGVLDRLKELRNLCIKYNRAPFHTLIAPDSFTSFNDFAIADSLEVTEQKQEGGASVGRKRGELTLMTVEDFGYEAEAVRKLLWENLTDLKKFCDVIVTAHETEKYKKVPTKPGEPTRTELDGYKILGRDKIASRIPVKFDEIYHFMPKEVVATTKQLRRTVRFQDEMARSSIPQLQAGGTVTYDITGKEFYPFWKSMISKK